MSEATAQPEISVTPFGVGPARAVAPPEDRRFYIGLAAATVLHALLFAGFNSPQPRQVGDPSGAGDAVSVSLISEADLKGEATVADRAAGQPMPPPAPQQEAPRPVEPPAPQQQPEPAPPQPAAEPQAPAPQPPPPVSEQKATETLAPHQLSLEAAPPAEKPSTLNGKPIEKPLEKPTEHDTHAKQPTQKPKEATKTPPQKMRTAKLDLSLPPPQSFSAPMGSGGGGVERPAGITQSGENDAFARDVIRALQRTMPQLRDTLGRVTVRITLDMNGGWVSTQIIRPSNIAGLDQNVVFATRQSSFPFPPRNAKPVDLIFFVTYIYR